MDADDFDSAEAALCLIYTLVEENIADGDKSEGNGASPDWRDDSKELVMLEKLGTMPWADVLCALMEGLARGWLERVHLIPSPDDKEFPKQVAFEAVATERGKRAARAHARRKGWIK